MDEVFFELKIIYEKNNSPEIKKLIEEYVMAKALGNHLVINDVTNKIKKHTANTFMDITSPPVKQVKEECNCDSHTSNLDDLVYCKVCGRSMMTQPISQPKQVSTTYTKELETLYESLRMIQGYGPSKTSEISEKGSKYNQIIDHLKKRHENKSEITLFSVKQVISSLAITA